MRIIEIPYDPQTNTSIEVLKAKYIGNFAIRIIFNDGNEKLVDFKPFLSQSAHPSIKKYLHEENFKNFKIRNGNLHWNDYELIFPVADLYEGKIN